MIQTDKVNLKFLTGLLNSKVVKFWLKNKGKMQGSNYQLDKEPLQQIPIAVAPIEVQSKVAEIVDTIILKKNDEPHADIRELENNIDSIIYGIYGLKDPDIQIIEDYLNN